MMRRLLAGVVAAIACAVALLAGWLHWGREWPWASAVLAAAAVPVVVDAAILGQQFVIGAWFRRRTRPDLRFGAGASLRAWLGEIAASLRTFFYAQLRYGARALPSGDAPGRVPVLLVHGYFCNRGIWQPLARWLAARGHAVGSVNLEPVFASIDDYVPLVAEGIERLRARTGAARVAVVAHSMGGLAVRAFVARHGAGALCAVVTLGTPHRGTWLAGFGHGRNVSEMALDSDWLRTLAAREPASARALFTVVLSHHDNIVVPQAIQTLEGARTVELAARGHVALAYDRAVWGLAARAIDAGASVGGSAGPGAGTIVV
ncbi:MAG: alpha/beta hydrolase [Burkholderiales bacterium]|nr:alpha/beta hydrolase [Burkholderiales bacterium]OJX08332.1 MAG: hypothetical protein BGO72_02930 [Burkholderiales bacterium 70-64]